MENLLKFANSEHEEISNWKFFTYKQIDPEGCLLLCSTASKILEVHSVLLGRSVIRNPLSVFRPGTRSTNCCKATENPNNNSSWRYALDEPKIGGLNMARDTFIFSLTAIRIHNKSEKISTVDNAETRILGLGNRLTQHDSSFGNGKFHSINKTITQTDASQKGCWHTIRKYQ